MANITGDAYKYAQSAPAGDKSVYVNLDAINDLPEEFEAVVTFVTYDPKKLDESFSRVGGSDNNPMYQPKPELMYKIAEACGISGGDESETSPITEEVDINPMLCKGLDASPTYRRMAVGRSVSKRSSRLMEDGSLLWSSLCTSEYNVWERCLELWSKEEQYSEGYTKQSKYPPKYENKYKRRAHFDSEMKFAHAKAETKAYLKTIRELAGMPTGYASTDLTSGKFVFSRIRRSKAVLKMETAARLSAISRGIEQNGNNILFGNTAPQLPDIPLDEDDIPPQETEIEIVAVFSEYISAMQDGDLKDRAIATLNWLKSEKDPKSNAKYYKKAIDNLHEIEDATPEAFRIIHKLYED